MFNRKIGLIVLFLFVLMTSTHAVFTTIFEDNFNDGSITDWDINSGSWSASNLDLNGANFDGGSISHSILMPAGAYYQIHFTAKTSNAGLNGEIFFFTDQNGTGNINGYELLLQNTTVLFRKRVNGTPTTLFSSSGVTLNTLHTIDINVSATNFQVYIDGTQIGSVTDTTYNTGSKIMFSTENGATAWAFDELIVRANYSANFATITVLRPINEKTLLPVDGNWSAELTNGTGASYQTGNDSSKTFIGIKSDTIANNFFVDDSNSGVDSFFPRQYVAYLSLSDSNYYFIQPYLIPVADGVQVNVTVKDNTIGNPTIPGVRLQVTKTINGLSTIVEDSLTNFAGVSQFTLLHQIPYSITAMSQNESDIFFPLNNISNTFTDSAEQFVMFINYSDSNYNLSLNNYDINIAPNTDFLTSGNQNIDINIDVNFSFNQIVYEALDGNVVVSSDTDLVSPAGHVFNLNLNNFDTNYLLIHVQIQTIDKNIDYYKSYIISNTNNIIINEFRNIRNYLSPTSLLMIILFVLLFSFSIIGESPIGNNESRVILFVIEIGFFVWLWFFDNYWIIMAFIGAVLGTTIIYLYSKNRGS